MTCFTISDKKYHFIGATMFTNNPDIVHHLQLFMCHFPGKFVMDSGLYDLSALCSDKHHIQYYGTCTKFKKRKFLTIFVRPHLPRKRKLEKHLNLL